MSFSDNNNCLKVLCEIIIEKDRELSEEIKELRWTAVKNQEALATNLMDIIRHKLIEWGIHIQSFENAMSRENALNTMFYLIETIQSDDFNEFEQLKTIKDLLSKDIRTPEKIFDCLERIPDLLTELQARVTVYNVDIERRIHIYRSLKEFACELFTVLSCVKKKLNNLHSDNVKHLNDVLMEYMVQLISSSFVLTVYPPRTVKKGTDNKSGTHFKTTLNCLIESERLFSKESFQPYFLTEGDLKEFAETKQAKKDCAIKFKVNNVKSNAWELNMLWIPPKRLQKEGRKSEKITNKKAIILITFKAWSNPCLFSQFEVNASLYSDTVVSIVHTNQETDALLTILWDDYFRFDRLAYLHEGFFRCKESVTIQDVIDVISRYFEKETSRSLTLSNQDFLQKKLFKSVANGLVTSNQFCSQIMPESTISFGNWILSIIKLLKIAGNCDLWKNDFIDGFMRKDVDSLFNNYLPGTFALRFSEKSPKIGVLVKLPNDVLEAWNPFSAEECRNRNLCERLMDFQELQLLRTASGTIVKKEEVLSRFIDCKEPDEGYTERGQLSRILRSNIYNDPVEVFGDEDTESMDINPFFGQEMDDDFYNDS